MRSSRFIGAIGLGCLVLSASGGCDRPPERRLSADAGGHRVEMLIVGEGGPTVVLEGGLPGGSGIGWDQVQGQVASFARVVAYNRAGIGTSEIGPLPRHAEQIAAELHTALSNAGLPPPYVLVGQSMGGPYIRVFAKMYPDDVCGMVLVDPTQPERYDSMEDLETWFAAHAPDQWARVEALCQKVPEGSECMIASSVKWLEEYLAELPESRRSTMRREWWSMVENAPEESLSPALSPGASEEFRAASDTFAQTIDARPLPDVPIILLAAGQQLDFVGQMTGSLNPNTRDLLQEVRRRKIDGYERWVKTIPGAKLVIAEHSGHNIQTEDPRLVIDAIREVVAEAGYLADSE